MTRGGIPNIPEDADLLHAALIYGTEGCYVGPIRMGTVDATGKRPGAKDPGSVLGKGWQTKTSTNKDQIVEWFAGTACNGVFLHAGRSGYVIFDVDKPELVPEVLARALWHNWDDPVEDREARVPYQSTRPDQPGRGHYLMLQPRDRVLGNGHGTLGSAWGEIRGNNGVIVLEPTQHESDGLYRWQITGPVPPLTPELDTALPSVDASTEEVGPASDDRIEDFLGRCVGTDNEDLLKGPLRAFEKEVADGASRHDTATKIAAQIMREALMGYYPARFAANSLYDLFNERLRGTKGRFPSAEYKSIIAWAVAQAETIDVAARRAEMDERLRVRDEKRGFAPKPAPAPETAVAAVEIERDPFGLLKPDPDKYFADKTIGLNVEMLATDILDMGPLAIGPEGEFWEYVGGVWKSTKRKAPIRNRCVHLLGPRYRQSHANNAADVVEARIPDIKCDPVSDYFNCRNGMFNWRKGVLEPHDPGYFSTVQFPWDWDSNAECPMFDKFIADTLSEDYALLCWQMIGYLLYSGNPRQVAFMLVGKGGEGKGTLLRVLTAMLGPSNISTESLSALNKDKFSAINLFGMIANIAGDIEKKFLEETNIFKAITGEDRIPAEHKYGSRFSFLPWAVPVFSANAIPPSADVSLGYLRRWQMIEFLKQVAAEDKILGFSDLLSKEIPGIARRALTYLAGVLSDGFKRDGEIADGQEKFAMNVDQVRLWIDECCEPWPVHIVGQQNRTPRSDLYKSYRAWASENRNGELKSHEFYARLETAGFTPKKINGVRYIEGIRVVVLGMTGTVYDKSEPDASPVVEPDALIDRWSTAG